MEKDLVKLKFRLLSIKRKKEIVLKDRFYLVHDACTFRTWALYESYIDDVRMVHGHYTK